MNSRRLRLVPALALLGAVAASGQLPGVPAADSTVAPARRTDPFERTRTQINHLLAQRIDPPAFDPTTFNPFQVGALPGTGPTQPENGTTIEPPTRPPDEVILASVGPTVRVTGFFARENRSYVSIDGVPRREGDFVPLTYRGTTVNVQVKHVEPGRLILGLGAAEYTVRF